MRIARLQAVTGGGKVGGTSTLLYLTRNLEAVGGGVGRRDLGRVGGWVCGRFHRGVSRRVVSGLATRRSGGLFRKPGVV